VSKNRMATETTQMDSNSRHDFLTKTAAVVAAAAATGIIAEEAFAQQHTEMIRGYSTELKLEVDPNLPEEQRAFQRTVFHAFRAMEKLDVHQTTEREPGNLQADQTKTHNEALVDNVHSQNISLHYDEALSQRDDVRRFLLKQLASLLKIVTLETKRNGIQAKFIRSASSAQLQDLNPIRRFEPRIDYIAKQLHTMLEFIRFFVDEEELAVISFQLNNLEDWLVNVDTDRSVGDPYISVLQYLSWGCRAACKFCLHQNDPDGRWTKSRNWKTSMEEVATRLKYYDPQSGTALFRTQDYSYYEILAHPHFIETIRQVREKTKNIIAFTTNGVVLTKEFIQDLSEFKPYYFVLSLNSANPVIRKEVMRGTHHEIAINSLPLLKKHKILYSVSIVPWHENPLADLAETIRYADENDAYLIRVNLDAYSQHFSGEYAHVLRGNRMDFWRKVVQCVRSIRHEIGTPIVFQPSLFEENIYGEYTTEASINGVIRNSPAAKAGLRYGDKVIQIDDFVVNFKTLAANTLRMYNSYRVERFTIKVQRGSDTLTFYIEETFVPPEENTSYPHFPYLDVGKHSMNPIYPYGILLQPTLNPKYLWDIEAIIAKYQAKNVLFLSSLLIEPTFSRLIKNTGFLRGEDIDFWIDVPESRHFLGGSIIVGDLLVVDDFIECIQKQNKEIDLVIIPSTPFGNWGRDISGKCFNEIERTVKIPVELLQNEIIFAI
jgi:sulfatase maturation enzyme AslB (radical SAM superfamily)